MELRARKVHAEEKKLWLSETQVVMFHAVLVRDAPLDNGLRSPLEYGSHRPFHPSERLH